MTLQQAQRVLTICLLDLGINPDSIQIAKALQDEGYGIALSCGDDGACFDTPVGALTYACEIAY